MNYALYLSNNASPFATGGGGYRFESMVGAYYLLSLLKGTSTRGIDGITKLVKFQQKFEGHLLDDIVIIANDGEIDRTLSIQVRHIINFTKDDPDFNKLIIDCWKMFKNKDGAKFVVNSDKLGIVSSSIPEKVKRHLVSVLEIARSMHNAESFFENIMNNAHAQEKKNYLEMIKYIIYKDESTISDADLWQFLRSLNIMGFDIENDGSSDRVKCLDDALSLIVDGDINQAKLLFENLTALSADLAKHAGSVDLSMLRQKLTSFHIRESLNFNRDVQKLRKYSNKVLDYVHDKIGNDLQLPRIMQLDEIEEKTKKNDVVILKGEPYAGKSVLLKLLANRLRGDGEVLAFSVDRIDGTDLAQFLKILDIKHDFEELLSAIGSTPSRCILIDGLEQLGYQQNKIRMIKELFCAVQNYNRSLLKNNGPPEYCWKIVATCRLQELKDVLLLLQDKISSLDFVDVSELTDKEINQIISKNPQLDSILKKKNTSDVARRAGYIDMLIRKVSFDVQTIPAIITESWFYDSFWHQVVRLGNGTRVGKGHADDREDIMKKIGLKSISNEKNISQTSDMDTISLEGLLSDELIIKEDNHLRFYHDVIEDYSITTILIHENEDIVNFLKNNQEYRRILRPFDLYVSKILEVDKSSDKWFELLNSLANSDLSPIWYHEALTNPISTSSIIEIIPLIENHLLLNNGLLLTKLLKALRSVAVETSPTILKMVANPDSPDIQKKISHFTVPLQDKWEPILEFTVNNLDKIDDNCLFEFYNVVSSWYANSNNIVLKTQIANLAFDFFKKRFTDEFGIESSLSYDDRRKLRKTLLKIILWSADCIPEKVDAFLKKYVLQADKNYGIADVLMRYYGWAMICKFLPKTSLDVLESIFCEKIPEGKRLGHHDFFHLGIHSLPEFNPPTPDNGPFLFFLRMHEEGLELIHRVVNHSTKVWKMREEIEYQKKPTPQTIHLPNKTIEVFGNEDVFRWFRFMSLGQAEVTSALMALEKWMAEQIKNGVNPKDLIEKVLSGTSSVAVVGVCTSIALQFIKISHEAILPILEIPAFWQMDFRRFTDDLRAESGIRSFQESLSFSNNDKKDYEKLIELAKQPHRQTTLKDIPTQILFSSTDDIRKKMQEELEKFPDSIPIFYEEEQNDVDLLKKRKRDCEIWAAQGKPENYKKIKVAGNQILIEFDRDSQLTEEEKIEDKKIETIAKLNNFWGWAYSLLDKNNILQGFTIESAIDYVEKIDDEFLQSLDGFHRQMVLDSVSCFISALIIHKWDTIVSLNRDNWCIETFTDIVNIELPKENSVSIFPMRWNRAIAKALPYVLMRFPKKKKFEKYVLSYAVNENDEVRNFLFLSLRILWNQNDQIVIKCIDLVIKKWSNLRDFRNETYTDLFRFMCIIHVLHELPILKKVQTKQQIKETLEKMLRLTIQHYQEGQKEDGYNEWHTQAYQWNWGFFPILADILLRFNDFRSELMNIIDDDWEKTPAMMEDFLRQLLLRGTLPELEKTLLIIWKHYFDKILNSQYTKKFTYEDGDYRENILGLLIFADPTGIVSWKKPEWVPLNDMINEIDVWCQRFSTKIECLESLIKLLDTIGKKFVLQYGIRWLHNSVTKINKTTLTSSNLVDKLSALLWDVWHSHENNIKENPSTYQQFVTIVDLLVTNNDRLAYSLKEKLTD